ncbi:MAG TPA: hypothetical protein PKN62_02920 [bacterium]|nr:hypothetical protein [bacterium]
MAEDIRLIIISGCSGSGKRTLMNSLRQQSGFCFFKTVTTKLPHDSDPDGDFDYVSTEEFKGQLIAGEIILPTMVSGNYYGVYFQEFEKALNSDQVYVRSVAPDNFADYYELAGDKVIFLYIELNDPERGVNRMLKSGGMTDGAILQRMRDEHNWSRKIDELIDQGLPIFKLTSIDQARTLKEAQSALEFVQTELAETEC